MVESVNEYELRAEAAIAVAHTRLSGDVWGVDTPLWYDELSPYTVWVQDTPTSEPQPVVVTVEEIESHIASGA